MNKNDSKHRVENTVYQGAMINSDGREIPITEDMIQQACHWFEEYAAKHSIKTQAPSNH